MAHRRMLSGVALLAAVLTACTPAPAPPGTASSAPAPSAPAPSAPAPMPTSSSRPPGGPSDLIKHTDLVVGTMIRGGTGPCYGLRTDDGTEYALYSDKGYELPFGKRVKLRTAYTSLSIDCGAGRLVEVVAVEEIY